MSSSTDSLPPDEPRDLTFRRCLGIALAVVLAVLIWHYHGGERTKVRIHDCLDSWVASAAIFAKSDELFCSGNPIFAAEMGGIPRNCLGSEFYLPVLPYRYLTAFHAYTVNDLFLRIVAFFGMALLLRTHALPDGPPWINAGAACAFALLPFYNFGLCVAGQPLFFYAALNLGADRNKWISLLIIALFPFFSLLVFSGFALAPLLAIYWVYRYVRTRRLNGWLLAAIVLFSAASLLSSYRMFANWFVHSNYVSSRTEFGADEGSSFQHAIKIALLNLVFGQYHATSEQCPFILAAALLALATCVPRRSPDDHISWHRGWRGVFGDECASPSFLLLAALLMAAGGISLFYGLVDWRGTVTLIAATHSEMLRSFQFGRVHWLHPVVWGTIFACSLEHIVRRVRSGKAIAVGLLALQLLVLLPGFCEATISFHDFYSPQLFTEIRDYINKPQATYRVASLGMFPSIALYNGFYVVDGYCPDYPLVHKQRFRKVIAAELAKNATIREYFDDWGSRCYLFSAELGKNYMFTKDNPTRTVKSLEIDVRALYAMDVRYILSAVKIDNARAIGLELDRVFERSDSPWIIYLYRLEVPLAPSRTAGLKPSAALHGATSR